MVQVTSPIKVKFQQENRILLDLDNQLSSGPGLLSVRFHDVYKLHGITMFMNNY